MNKYFAHSLKELPVNQWHKLEDHLENVAKIASEFASDFNAQNWGYLAGLWHDIGKYSNEFQKMLLSTGDPDTHIEKKKGAPIIQLPAQNMP